MNDDIFNEQEISSNEVEFDTTVFKEKFAHFLTKTGKQYTSSSLKYLSDRGIENRLLESLLLHLPDGAIIAGGFALSVVVEDKNAKDIDFFFTSEKAFIETYDLFMNSNRDENSDDWAYDGYTVDENTISKSSRFVLFTHPTRPSVQLMKMVWYDDAAHVIDTFDFTIAQFAFTNKEFVYNGESMLDLSKKRLLLHRMQFPASTLRRLIKYTSKGYYACPGSLTTIATAIQEFTGELDVNQVVYVD